MIAARFLFVCFLTAILDYTAFFLASLFTPSVLLCQIAGRLASIPFNYFMLRSKVFESAVPHQSSGPKFLLLYATAFGLAWAIIVWMNGLLPIQNDKARLIVAKMIAEGSILIGKFFIQKHLIFNPPSGSLQSKPGC
jgi:putative flippase GtrA